MQFQSTMEYCSNSFLLQKLFYLLLAPNLLQFLCNLREFLFFFKKFDIHRPIFWIVFIQIFVLHVTKFLILILTNLWQIVILSWYFNSIHNSLSNFSSPYCIMFLVLLSLLQVSLPYFYDFSSFSYWICEASIDYASK